MLKALFPFFFFLLLFSPLVSFAGEQEPLPPGTLTVQKYTEFLCATAATDSCSLYNEKMGDDLLSPCIIREGEPGSYSYQAISKNADDPVLYVSRLSAKRYCNWLQNGKPEGEQDETTTERGAYILDGTIDGDPEQEEAATYFLPASINSEIDPSLASNLTTYVIMTHLGDSFRFSNTSSQDETETWTVGDVIAGVAGLAAVLHYRGGMHGEESSDNHYVDSADTTEQARRKEESHEISAEQRGDNTSSKLDQEGSASTTRSAAHPKPWANSTAATINTDYLSWLATQHPSKKSLIEQPTSLFQATQYSSLMRARLSLLNNNLHCLDNSDAALVTWLQQSQPLLYEKYLNFYTSRKPAEFQTTCLSRWFQDPEYSREQAYQVFITELTKEHEIGPQYWPYERLLAKWKEQRQTRGLRFTEALLFDCSKSLEQATGEKVALSDKLSKLSPTDGFFKSDSRFSQWGPNLKIYLTSSSYQWFENTEINPVYITLHNKLLSPETPITWNSQEEWHQWGEEFKKSSALAKEAITKKTDLLDDWENWRENFYASLSLDQAERQRAADIWKDQVEATLDELNKLSEIVQNIRDEHQITSPLRSKTEFEILFETTFRHLHRISTHIKDAPLTVLKSLFEQESQIKNFLISWQESLDKNSYDPDLVLSTFQLQIKTVITATQTLANLVCEHQAQALPLRIIVEEERQLQQKIAATPELDITSLGSNDTDQTDSEENSPVRNNSEENIQLISPAKKRLSQFVFPKMVKENSNRTRPRSLVSDSSNSLL